MTGSNLFVENATEVPYWLNKEEDHKYISETIISNDTSTFGWNQKQSHNVYGQSGQYRTNVVCGDI